MSYDPGLNIELQGQDDQGVWTAIIGAGLDVQIVVTGTPEAGWEVYSLTFQGVTTLAAPQLQHYTVTPPAVTALDRAVSLA